jgi:hypothetical protein
MVGPKAAASAASFIDWLASTLVAAERGQGRNMVTATAADTVIKAIRIKTERLRVEYSDAESARVGSSLLITHTPVSYVRSTEWPGLIVAGSPSIQLGIDPARITPRSHRDQVIREGCEPGTVKSDSRTWLADAHPSCRLRGMSGLFLLTVERESIRSLTSRDALRVSSYRN